MAKNEGTPDEPVDTLAPTQEDGLKVIEYALKDAQVPVETAVVHVRRRRWTRQRDPIGDGDGDGDGNDNAT